MARMIVAFLVVLVMSSVVACSASNSEPRVSAPSQTSATRYGAPGVARPRDLGSRTAAPCATLLTAKQVGEMGLEDGRYRLVLGKTPSCRWEGREPQRSVTVAVDLTQNLFVNTYRARLLPILRPISIEDLPAVESQSTADSSLCTTTVGVAAAQSLDITTSVGDVIAGRPVIDPCAEGRRVAEAVVATLPPA